MAYALLSSINVTGFGLTTWDNSASPVDTTGADLITISFGQYAGGTALIIDTDSKGNVYTLAKAKSSGSITRAGIFYKQNPTVGSGHYFGAHGGTAAFSLAVRCWTGSASSPLDTNSGDGSALSGTSLTLSSVTPTVDNCLIMAAFALGDNSTNYSVDSPLIELNEIPWVNSDHEGLESAYVIQTTATAITAKANWTSSADNSGVIVAFKAAAGAAATLPPRGLSVPQSMTRASLW